jgi:hypothetical protein
LNVKEMHARDEFVVDGVVTGDDGVAVIATGVWRDRGSAAV